MISQGQYSVSLSVGSGDISRVAVGQSATVTVTTSSAAGGRGGLFAQLFGGGRGGGLGGGTAPVAPPLAAAGRAARVAPRARAGLGASATGTVQLGEQGRLRSSGVAGYPVVITFNADASAFYPGATVTGAIATQAKSDAIQVPTRAVSTRTATPW